MEEKTGAGGKPQAYNKENGRWISQGQALVNIVKDFRAGNEVPKIITISEVNDREKSEIERITGDKITRAIIHTIHVDELKHIENRHGIKGVADNSMSDLSDYKYIPLVLHDFDRIELLKTKNGESVFSSRYKNKYGQQAQLIRFEKIINNEYFYVVEALTDTKRGDLSIITAYKEKIRSII